MTYDSSNKRSSNEWGEGVDSKYEAYVSFWNLFFHSLQYVYYVNLN